MIESATGINLKSFHIPSPSFQSSVSDISMNLIKFENDIAERSGPRGQLQVKYLLYFNGKKIETPIGLFYAVCKILRVDYAAVSGKGRTRELVTCRIVISKILKDNYDVTLMDICKILKCSNHTCVLYFLSKADRYSRTLPSTLATSERNGQRMFNDIYNIVMTQLTRK